MSDKIEKLPEDPRLGRTIVHLDERSRRFMVRGALFDEGAPLRTKTWRRPPAWDQKQTSQCVGFSTVGMIKSQPITSMVPLAARRDAKPDVLYHEAQKIDEWQGAEPSYYGTSCLAGAKVAHHRGWIPGYRWCFGLSDTLRTLSHWAPVLIGINWYDGMFDPDEAGFVKPSGRLAGGHAVELHGIDHRKEYVVGTNSWGLYWGLKGRFRMEFSVLDRLLREDGEAFTVAETVT
jgi:hypothetical protein